MQKRELNPRGETKIRLADHVVNPQKVPSTSPGHRIETHHPLNQVACRLGDASCAGAHATRLNRALSSRRSGSGHALLKLQRQYGNRYVQRVLAVSGKGRGEVEAAAEVETGIQRARGGGGQPLSSAVRAQMEPAFKADFSGVRVHADAAADSLSRSVNARAFTTGQDIFFRAGEHNPGSSSGRELLAHELTHVVQQNGNQLQRKLTVNRPGDRYEQEADRVAGAIIHREQQPVTKNSTEQSVSRQVEEEEEESIQTRTDESGIQRQEGLEEEEEEAVQAAPDGTRLQRRGVLNDGAILQRGASGRGLNPSGPPSAAPQEEEETSAARSAAGRSVRAASWHRPHAQRRAAQNRPPGIQRDLATPPPAVAPTAQPDLTADQIRSAITFNRRRYNVVGTRLIQDLVGTTPTGIWVADDIRAIAAIQETYGLTKDGKVGTNTFRFIDREVRAERLRRTDANCLTSLVINRGPENIVPSATGANMTRHFTMRTQFPSYCGCSNFEYRQFIRGHFTVTRAGTVHDEGGWFANLPAGRLNRGWQEDGHTGVPSINFGHRNRSSEADNRYLNDAGTVDMHNGCRYHGDDTPGGNYRGTVGITRPGFTPRSGDVLDIDVNFRGEVQRSGRVVRSKRWSALRRRFTLP